MVKPSKNVPGKSTQLFIRTRHWVYHEIVWNTLNEKELAVWLLLKSDKRR